MRGGDDPVLLDEASPTKVSPATVDGDLKGDLVRPFPRKYFPAIHYPAKKTILYGSLSFVEVKENVPCLKCQIEYFVNGRLNPGMCPCDLLRSSYRRLPLLHLHLLGLQHGETQRGLGPKHSALPPCYSDPIRFVRKRRLTSH